MRAIELFEYDVRKVATLDLSKKITDNSLPKNSTIDKLAEFLETTYKLSGEIVFWLLHRYVNGTARWEDIESRIIPGLEKYQKLKNKKLLPPELRDINRIKSFDEFENLLDKFKEDEVVSGKDQEKEIENNFYKTKQAELIYNDNTIKVIAIRSKDASIYFGRNTRWCTAAKKNNMFDDYYKNYNDPLYIILIKPTNERYQFHFGTNQYMNEQDKEVDPIKLSNKYPILKLVFDKISKTNPAAIIFNQNPTEDELKAAVEVNGQYIKYIKNPSEELQLDAISQHSVNIQYIKHPTERAQLTAVGMHGNAIQFIKNPSEKAQLAAVQETGYSLQFIDNPSDAVKLAAIKSHGSTIKFVDDPTEEMQIAAVTSSEYAPDNIKYIKNPSERVQLAAIKTNYTSIYWISNPTLKVMLAAVKENPEAILGIKNPPPEVAMAAAEKQFGFKYRPDK